LRARGPFKPGGGPPAGPDAPPRRPPIAQAIPGVQGGRLRCAGLLRHHAEPELRQGVPQFQGAARHFTAPPAANRSDTRVWAGAASGGPGRPRGAPREAPKMYHRPIGRPLAPARAPLRLPTTAVHQGRHPVRRSGALRPGVGEHRHRDALCGAGASPPPHPAAARIPPLPPAARGVPLDAAQLERGRRRGARGRGAEDGAREGASCRRRRHALTNNPPSHAALRAQTHVDNSFGNSLAFTMNNTCAPWLRRLPLAAPPFLFPRALSLSACICRARHPEPSPPPCPHDHATYVHIRATRHDAGTART